MKHSCHPLDRAGQGVEYPELSPLISKLVSESFTRIMVGVKMNSVDVLLTRTGKAGYQM